MKKILIILGILISSYCFSFPEYEIKQPTYEFKSTSREKPMTTLDNNSSTYSSTIYSIGSTEASYNGPRRALGHDDEGEGPGYNPADPAQPISSILPLFLFVFIYFIIKRKRLSRR